MACSDTDYSGLITEDATVTISPSLPLYSLRYLERSQLVATRRLLVLCCKTTTTGDEHAHKSVIMRLWIWLCASQLDGVGGGGGGGDWQDKTAAGGGGRIWTDLWCCEEKNKFDQLQINVRNNNCIWIFGKWWIYCVFVLIYTAKRWTRTTTTTTLLYLYYGVIAYQDNIIVSWTRSDLLNIYIYKLFISNRGNARDEIAVIFTYTHVKELVFYWNRSFYKIGYQTN